MSAIQKISSNLWFNDEAEEAVNFYLSVFKAGEILNVTRFNKAGFEIHKRPAGSIMTIEFILEGQRFVALNGGPMFKFNEAVSFIINCDTQEEIDYYWNKLKEGGDETAQVCGWLKDKFGLSWQVVPVILDKMFKEADSERAERAMTAMLQMKKLDIATLEKAYNG